MPRHRRSADHRNGTSVPSVTEGETKLIPVIRDRIRLWRQTCNDFRGRFHEHLDFG